MAVGNTFDLWQKDVFFSAAEEVQESADVMDSVFRWWLRERNEGHKHGLVDELRRELQTALGTAKWQLEEFERAVRQSHGNLPSDKNTINRHSQFIVAIEEHISDVERALGDSLVKEGKQPLRWVQLDEGERDDLALFLSSAPPSSQRSTDVHTSGDVDCAQDGGLPNSIESFKEVVTFSNDAKYVVELETNELARTKDEMCSQAEQNNGQRRTRSSPDIAAWKIVIAHGEDEERKPLETRTESPVRTHNFFSFMKGAKLTAKAKWLRSSFGKAKKEDHLPVRQEISSNLDLRGVTRVSQKLNVLSERGRNCLSDCKVGTNSCLLESQHQVSGYHMQLKRSLRFTLLLVLSMLLVEISM
ncbi:hypothetical protein Taro_022678 [Colocasia esculenta]|uniref:Syntaxin 6/10/61 N-terminal domain-containing protein n=1 Tax=Colocasia esculenta TaxID=4460 RepID=A0A843V2J9_COLES|nr:hypothetical protein [Colocasia esculenta]